MGDLRGHDRGHQRGGLTTSTGVAGRPDAAAVPDSDTSGGEQRLLTGWGRTAPTRALVVEPGSADEVRALLATAGPAA